LETAVSLPRNCLDLMSLTWKELEALDKRKTVVFLVMAPVEEHGHHLPLGVDVYAGKYWEKLAMVRLAAELSDYSFLYLPAIPFACGCIPGFIGNLHVKQRTVRQVTWELLKNITGWGIQHIVIIASHGDPRHNIAIEEACAKLNRKYGVRAISPMGAMFSYDELKMDLEFPAAIQDKLATYPHDIHAGWIETSFMLDMNASLVKSTYKNQPGFDIRPEQMMFMKKVAEKVKGYGHIGFPAEAASDLGRQLNENTVNYLAKVVKAFLLRQDYEIYQHHSLYAKRILGTDFLRNTLLGLIVPALYRRLRKSKESETPA